VFAGGFDLAAAEAICGDEPLMPEDVLDLVSSLVEKSLVMTTDLEDGVRYSMLETIRDYAREKLQAAGDTEPTAVRHCHHYFAFAKSIRDGVVGPDQALWIQRGETELDNMRVALALALSGATDPFIAVKFSIALMTFWMLRGYTSEGRGIVRAARNLPAVQASDMAHAHALYVEAALATSESDHAEARDMLERCLELRRSLGDPVEIAATLSTLSWARLQAGDPERARLSESEALDIFRSAGERLGEAYGLVHMGQIALWTGEEALARSSLDAALAIAKELQNREIEGEAELVLGECAFEFGRAQDARRHLSRSLDVCREAADRRGESHALWWLARLDLESQDVQQAAEALGRVLSTFRDFAMHEELAGCLEDHVVVAARRVQPVAAVQIAAAVQAYRQRLGLALSTHGRQRWGARLQQVRSALAEREFDQAWADGGSLDLNAAIRLATSPQPQLAGV
jgi:tetratricopeptide (TPR) repeat protein